MSGRRSEKGVGRGKVVGGVALRRFVLVLRDLSIHVSHLIGQVPQRLLGPTPFPLDRLIAILGALLEDNDVDTRPHAPQFTIPGEYTDMEITRVHVYASVRQVFLALNMLTLTLLQIMELTQNRLLHRTTPSDRLDGPPMFKCGVAYDVVLDLAREIQVPLNDLMWDPA